jgi:hypothetical protein
MASTLPNFIKIILITLLLNCVACSRQVTDEALLNIITSPIFEMKLHASVEQGNNFADAFLNYAKANNLAGIELDGNPTPGKKREPGTLQINSKQGYPLFIFDNTIDQQVFELSAHPSDIPLAKQHIYNLVKTLTTDFHGKVELISCDVKILDCDRIKSLLPMKSMSNRGHPQI